MLSPVLFSTLFFRLIVNICFDLLKKVIGGWGALKFGGLKVISVSMLTSSILTIIIVPIANLDSIPALFVLRFLIGFCHVIFIWLVSLFCWCLKKMYALEKGFTLPALSFMFVRWAPPEEKSTLVGFATSFTHIGSVVSTLFGSFLCEYGFLEGWGSIFIIFGW